MLAQRRGVPAGAPTSVTVHVKNGWLPRATHGWRIHSIGAFTGPKGWYTIVVLTQDNPTHGLRRDHDRGHRPGRQPPSQPHGEVRHPAIHGQPILGTPDEQLPSLPGIP